MPSVPSWNPFKTGMLLYFKQANKTRITPQKQNMTTTKPYLKKREHFLFVTLLIHFMLNTYVIEEGGKKQIYTSSATSFHLLNIHSVIPPE